MRRPVPAFFPPIIGWCSLAIGFCALNYRYMM